jgi:hypothetical protein
VSDCDAANVGEPSSYDADGNLTADALGTYAWDGGTLDTPQPARRARSRGDRGRCPRRRVKGEPAGGGHAGVRHPEGDVRV